MTYYNQWILKDQLLLGSRIPSSEAYQELIDGKGVTHILDLEKKCDLTLDKSLTSSTTVLHMYFPDDGRNRPDWFWRAGFEFAREAIQAGGTVYVHCRQGVSRGPSMTYGILRYFERLPEKRTSVVNAFDMEPEEKVVPGGQEIVYKAQIEAFLDRVCDM